MDKLEERLAGLSPEQRELVRRLLKQENIDAGDLLDNATAASEAGIVSIEARDAYPLSSAQKRLFILDRMGEAGDAYIIHDFRFLDHFSDPEKIEAVFRTLIRRHESLRTSFHFEDKEPVQRIHDECDIDFSLSCTDCRDEVEQGEALSTAIAGLTRPFRLEDAPLLRAGVILLPRERIVLATVMHHIISDGTSLSILFSEFHRLFAGDSLSNLSITYKDYAVWQSNRFNDGGLDKQRRFWLDEFSGLEAMNLLPYDLPPGVEQDYSGGSAIIRLPHDELRILERFASARGATLNMVMVTALIILLHRLGCGGDIVVGVPVAGRNHELLREIVGMFVNTVALRVKIEESAPIHVVLETVKRNHINGLENQDFPFEELVDALKLPRDTGRNPLFDVMFAWQEFSGDRSSEALAPPFRLQHLSSRFDMTWNVFPHTNGLDIEVEYRSSLFFPSTIDRFGECFRRICFFITRHPNLLPGALEIVSDAEKDSILRAFNDTTIEVPYETICHAFLRQAGQRPYGIALICGEGTLSYSFLQHQSQTLARRLQARGIGARHIVGIMIDRSPELMIGILGVLFSGAIYLPIEPGYPPERIAFIKNDSGMKLCLEAGFVSRDEASDDDCEEKFEMMTPSPNDLAYIIYTSGSTGTPKGVAVEHYSIFNRLQWLQRRYPLGPGDVVLQKTTIVFDVSVGELLGWISGGAALCMLPPGGHTNLPLLTREICRNKITAIHFVPSMMKVFLDYVEEMKLACQLRSLRQVWSSGESLASDTARRFKRLFAGMGIKYLNLYGPTETTVEVSFFDTDSNYSAAAVPIGRPIDNTAIVVVNRHFCLCPIGVPGEILIGGTAVARGYVNLPELTAQRFVKAPIPGFPENTFLSGDLGRFLPDGTIECLGRIDQQLKLRGFRIEPAEIRNRILQFNGVTDAVVILMGDRGDRQLCAYIVVSTPIDSGELVEYLSLHLPAYMVPAHLMTIDTIPVTSNGKLDRNALPRPCFAENEKDFQPVEAVDEKLQSIWAEVLGLEPSLIHANSDFFKLGGHSLKAMVLANRLKRDYGVELLLVDIFKHSLFRAQSGKIGTLRSQASIPVEPREKRDYYPLSSGQRRLYIEWQMDRGSVAYNMPLLVPIGNALEDDDAERIVKRLIGRHESLRTYFEERDDGPVQRIQDEPVFALRHLGDVAHDGQVQQVLNGFVQPFDLTSAPLIRCGFVSCGDGFALLLDMHHIVGDGASITILEQEFAALAQDEYLPPLTVQYRDYTLWQREMDDSGLSRQESFWMKTLAGDLPVLCLPEDFPRPEIRCFEGGMMAMGLEPRISHALREICRSRRVTMFMMVQALSSILFSKLGRVDDLVLGTVVRGRNHPDIERVVGMFVNTLPLRSFPTGEKTFGQFLEEVGRLTLAAFDNQDYPFERMVEKLVGHRNTSRHPLFDIMVELHEVAGDQAPRQINEADTGNALENQAAKFDITLVVVDDGEMLEIGWSYNRSLFRRESIRRFHDYFERIIELIIDNRAIPINAIDVAQRALDIECADDWPDGTERRIDSWFSATAAQFPEKTAVIAPDGLRRINYRELDHASSRVAMELLNRGLGQPAIVALLMEASIELAIALFGVMKAGGAFLPLDPATPANRLEYILKDSGVRYMISHGAIEKPLTFEGELILIEAGDSECEQQIIEGFATQTEDPAYIIYTSGTTGRPKGVVVSHGNLSTYTAWIIGEAVIGPDDRSMLLSSYAFDLGYTAIFSALLSGGSLMILDRDRYLSPELVVRFIQMEGITYLKTTPSLFSAILRSGYFSASTCSSLRLVILGGEPINVEDVEHALQLCGHIEFINHYGPTEATIGCIFHRIELGDFEAFKERPVIGRPIRGMNVCIVNRDHYRILQTNGSMGELAVAGSGIATGYLNQPELTLQRFPVDGPLQGRRMYLTGDLALRGPNGAIQLAGRIGNQVKIRGFRVELEEIEALLKRCAGVVEAVVVARQTAGAGHVLIAYLAPEDGIDTNVVRRRLAKDLPDYMMPSAMILLDRLPLTANNKVDRKALPEPELATGEPCSRPRDDFERRLAELWAGILKRDATAIGVEQNFFDIGGQSLKATILSSRIHKEFHVRMPLTAIFRFPTIRQMATYVRDADTQLHKGIAPVEKRDFYPLSSAQTRLYILQQINPGTTAYNRFRAVFLEHAVDFERIERAFEWLLQRHESLRTAFRMLDDRPVQQVLDCVNIFISRKQASNLDIVSETFIRPFALHEAPLLRAEIVALPGDRTVLLVDMHHIIADGISQDVMVRDFLVLYDGGAPGDLPLQYRDFAVWQNDSEFKRRVQAQENYWLKQLSSPLPLLDLPIDFPRPQIQQFDGSSVVLDLGPVITHRIRGLLKDADVTLFMLLLAVYYTWLARLTGQDDIIAGVPVAGRPHHDLQEIVGMFVNTLAMRGFPSGEATFWQFLGDTRVRVLEAFDNQDVQFEDLVERLDVRRDAGRNPLFDASFNVLNYLEITTRDARNHREDGDVPYEHRVAKFDLNATVIEEQDNLQIYFQYCTKLFKEATIRRYVLYFERIITSILERPQKKLKDLEMVPESELRRVLHEFNNPVDETFTGNNLCRLFLDQERTFPDRIAVIYDSEAISYRELGQRATQISCHLKHRGVGAENIVALHMQRSIALIESIFGILISGGAYMPLDLELPLRRKTFVLEDSKASSILANREDSASLPAECSEKVVIVEDIPRGGIISPVPEAALAYIIYTSGTTGIPKGVMIERHSVVNLVNSIKRDIYAEIHRARVALLAPVHFDASVKQIFPALLGGHSLAIVPARTRLYREALFRFFNLQAIDISDCTPAMLSVLLEEDGNLPVLPVSIWLIGGEALDRPLCRRLIDASIHKSVGIFNVYGPTECTDVSSISRVAEESGDDSLRIPIGKPISNARIYIYDRFDNLLPPGIPGQLVIAGVGVGRGYLNRPELTFEKFGRAGSRLYRTGDLARWREDGLLECLGRIDQQVKIRGYRVELQEIEHNLLSLDSVSEALALAIAGPGSDRQLAAYVVLKKNPEKTPLGSDSLRDHLEGLLPGYMIPAFITILDSFPLTSNGKIDVAALPHPQAGLAGAEICTPVDALERQLAVMWARLLSLEEAAIGTDADFFLLGGHSLKAMILMSRIEKEFGIHLPLVEMFRTPTIKGIARYIRANGKEEFAQIFAVEKKEYYPLSPAQKRFFLLHQLMPETTAYNMPHVIPLPPDIRFDRLEASLQAVIQRHETFRTAFITIDHQPVQRVLDSVDIKLHYLHEGGDIQAFIRPFDLSVPPLLRAAIASTADGVFLVVDFHHITGDGISTAIIEEETLHLYNGSLLDDLPLQYRDFAVWQAAQTQTRSIDSAFDYWGCALAGDIPVLNIPIDFPRPAVQNFDGDRLYFDCTPKQTTLIREFAEEHDVTLFMTLLAVFYIFLARLSGQEDIIVGTPVAGRGHADLERIVGPFVNTLPLRGKPVGSKSLTGFLRDVKEDVIAALEHQRLPFEELVDRLDIPRDAGRNPLFDVMFAFDNIRERHLEEAVDLVEERLPMVTRDHSRFDMTWSFSLHGDRLSGAVEYATALFETDTIRRFVSYFKTVAEKVATGGDPALGRMELLSPEEITRQLAAFNQTRTQLPTGISVLDLFFDQVRAHPHRVAVSGPSAFGGALLHLTYEALDFLATNVARALRDLRIQEGAIVPVICEHVVELTSGLLGILKANCAFLPIEPDVPLDRKRWILEDCGAAVVLTHQSCAGVDGLSARIVLLDDFVFDGRFNASSTPPSVAVINHAYVIYTSGTSGRPKGVVVGSQSLLNLCLWHQSVFFITPRDRASKLAGFGFDASIWEVFPYLTAGASLVIVPNSVKMDPVLLNRYFETFQVTVAFCPTPLCEAFLEIDNRSLRLLLTGGDKLKRSNPNAYRLINNYGPTEDTVVATSYEVEGDLADIPIGKPIWNQEIYICDQYGNAQPVGVPGELWISGEGLASGYLNQPDLTATSFAREYIADRGEVTVYKTGDVCRWKPDGNIEFLGRLDNQVQIRGFRIEMSEIERTILRSGKVKDVALVRHSRADGDSFLAAYLVLKDEEASIDGIRQFLEEHLPKYMIPAFMIPLEALPLTANGKIDRKRLPAPEMTGQGGIHPITSLERRLHKLWSGVLLLKQEEINVAADFFSLGGHSLKATILAGRIHKELNVEISLVDIFRYPTIRGQATWIEAAAPQRFAPINPIEKRDYYDLSPAQKRLYILQQFDRQRVVYNIPMLVPIAPGLDIETIECVFEALIGRHESLRTSFATVNETPVQRVHNNVEFLLENFDLTKESEEKDLDTVFVQFIRPFDLSCPPLIRGGVIDDGGMRRFLVLDMHHIISDGVSVQLLEHEFLALSRGDSLPPLAIQYKDYAAWLRCGKMKDRIKGQESFWLERFGGWLPEMELPMDFPRPRQRMYSGQSVLFRLEPDICRNLDEYSRRLGLTPFMTMLACLAMLIGKLSGREDVVIGTAVAGRRHADVEPLVGMFVNTLALRHFPHGNSRLNDYIDNVKQRTLEDFDRQDFPFEELVDRLQLERDTGRNPLFDVMVHYREAEDMDSGDSQSNIHRVSRFDMSWNFSRSGDRMSGSIEFSDELFRRPTVERFAGYFSQIAGQLSANKECLLKDIDMLPAGEKRRIMELSQGERRGVPALPIHELFRREVMDSGDRLAVEIGDGHLTYRELNRRSDSLAVYLRFLGIGRGCLAALFLHRSLEMITAILGVLKSGAAYIPLDPDYPLERLEYIVKDSDAAAVIVSADDHPFDPLFFRVVDIRTGIRNGEANAPNENQIDDPAYVIFTSGTTGKPKGVMIEHHSVANLALYQAHRFGIQKSERVLQFSSYCFDPSVEQMFIALFTGAGLVLVDRNTLLNSDRFHRYITKKQVTHLHAVPSFLALLDIEGAKTIKRVVAGGDICPPSLARYFSQFCDFYNKYGPTETTISSLEARFDHTGDVASVPIGRPLGNTSVYILDQYGNLAPEGVVGELFIGGSGVGRGYVNRPLLTCEAFVPNHLSGQGTMYRTGDFCRWNTDGAIDFLGRRDNQIKIRGFRIEAGEVERALLENEWVKEAVVVSRKSEDGDTMLIGYLVMAEDDENRLDGVRRSLDERLPSYMIPTMLVRLDSFPLNPNGKVDRSRLSALENTAQIAGVEFKTTLERSLQKIWAGVLSLDEQQIGRDSDFFSIGGHSLKATILAGRILKELEANLPLTEIFNRPTIGRLAEFIEASSPERFARIEPLEKRDYYRLSPAQARLYILHQLDRESTVYNMPMAVPLGEAVLPSVLTEVFGTLMERHESLRTLFVTLNDGPVQRVAERVEFSIEAYSGETIDSFIRPFDLSFAPLLRVGVSEGFLLLDLHHIISDGISLQILQQEFISIIEKRSLTALSIQYKDYAAWFADGWMQERLVRQEAYWLNLYSGDIPSVDLPIDFPRPGMSGFSGDLVRFSLDESDCNALAAVCQKQGITVFMALTAAFSILLSNLSGREDVVLGTVVAGRRHVDVERMVGMFVNTLALRITATGEKRLEDYLDYVRGLLLTAFDNQDYPFENLVEKLQPERKSGRNPLFDVMIECHEGEDAIDDDRLPMTHRVSRFDMSWTFVSHKRGMRGSVEFSDELYRRETILRFTDYFKTIFARLASGENLVINRIDILGSQERQWILDKLRGEASDVPVESLQHPFLRQAAGSGDHAAVELEDDFLTYHELDCRSNRLARHLIHHGAGSGHVVAVCLERSIEMIIAIVAVLKSGSAYVPLDPAYPPARLEYVLRDSGAVLTLVSGNNNPIRNLEITQVNVDCIEWLDEADNLEQYCEPQTPAYVIYTSGTTGNPRGVIVEHHSIANLIHTQIKNYGVDASDRILQFSSFSFDASVEQIFLALSSGAALVLVQRETILDIERFIEYIVTRRITHIDSVPSFLALLELPPNHHVRRVVSGGDVCPPALAKKFGERVEFFNAYGPTETTVTVLTGSVAIGSPLANTHAYILNTAGSPVPTGVAGELVIGGAGVARGYLNRPDLTDELFVTDPVARKGRVYRSGDMCRLNTVGEVEFIGRLDSQVKIRGNRVELSEIRHIVLEHQTVKDAAVICKVGDNGEAFIVAYVVAVDESFDAGSVRQHVARRLPSYMIPAHWMRIDMIPLSANGKLDLGQLPEPESGDGSRSTLPANEIEAGLLAIWSDVLELDKAKISTDFDFFSLGGHSLKATSMVSKIRSQMNFDVPLNEVFKTPTIKDLAAYINSVGKRRGSSANRQLVPLKINAEHLPNLFFIHDGLGQVSGYLKLCDLLAETHNYWGVQTQTKTEIRLDKVTLPELVAEHIDTIQGIQPQGPYFIAGWSMGGAIAFSVGRFLEAQGHEVRFLGLIDAGIPRQIFKLREKLKGNVTTFYAGKENIYTLDDWRLYCSGTFKSYYISGDHHSILSPPHVFELAAKFRRAVEINQRSHHIGK